MKYRIEPVNGSKLIWLNLNKSIARKDRMLDIITVKVIQHILSVSKMKTRRFDPEEEEEEEDCVVPSYLSPNSKHRGALYGYGGCTPIEAYNEVEETTNSPPKIMIRGYSGFLRQTKNVVGVPLIPSIEAQHEKLGISQKTLAEGGKLRHAGHLENKIEQSTLGSSFTNFRTYGKNMTLGERYQNAVYQLKKRGQSQEMLLRICQCKCSESVRSYADQHVKMRKIFEYFDLDGSNDLDEHEFRQFLELNNIYFDDIQSLALFAYFDQDRTGGISWESFSSHAMVQSPSAGMACIPKAITATIASDDWKDVSKIATSKKK